MVFRGKTKDASLSFISGALQEPAQFYAEEPNDHLTRSKLFANDPDRLVALYDVGIPQEALNAAISVAQKSKNWIRIQFESKLLKRVEECSPDILFDMEKKFEFTGLVSTELAAFSSNFVQAASALDEAIKAGNEEAAARYANASLSMILTFLGRMDEHYSDFGHFFQTATYQQYRAKLNTMKVADRRLIEAFYTQFESAIAVMRRVFDREIPAAQANKTVDLNAVFRWLTHVSQAVTSMYNAAYRVVNT